MLALEQEGDWWQVKYKNEFLLENLLQSSQIYPRQTAYLDRDHSRHPPHPIGRHPFLSYAS